MSTNKKTSRRQWLIGSLRWVLLGIFSGVSVHLLRRKPTITETACIDLKGYTGCRNCQRLKGCKLPRALSVKQFLNKQK